MCNPCSLLPCFQQPGMFAAQYIGANVAEAQGIDDFFKNLCETLGCRDRQEAGKITLLGIVHKNLLEAIKMSFPEAAGNDCLAPAVQGIIGGVGLAFAECPRGETAFLQALLTNIAPPVGELLACIFGAKRANEMELQLYRQAAPLAVDWISCLLPILMTLCQNQFRPPAPQPPKPGNPCCPPGGGGTPRPPMDTPQPNEQGRC